MLNFELRKETAEKLQKACVENLKASAELESTLLKLSHSKDTARKLIDDFNLYFKNIKNRTQDINEQYERNNLLIKELVNAYHIASAAQNKLINQVGVDEQTIRSITSKALASLCKEYGAEALGAASIKSTLFA